MGLTERLYYPDSYLIRFTAEILEIQNNRVYLDRTAFYPTSGGQLFDLGTLGNARVTEVVDEDGRIAHIIDGKLTPGHVEGTVDWDRRFDHMQQHTGQHLLSAVFAERLGLETVSVHLGEETSTVDLDSPTIEARSIEQVERWANEAIVRNLPVGISFEDAATVEGLRKASARSGVLRIVTIEGMDRSACGGTHVRATGEIGSILLRKTEKIRNSTRVEFVCGLRAVAAARADFAALKEQTSTHQTRLGEIEKERRKLITELAGFRGRELYQQTAPGADGIRYVVRRVPEIDDSTRGEAQAFTQGSRAVYAAIAGSSVLLAASADSGINAGAIIKQFATKGGGSATMAQGSVPDPEALIQSLSH